MLSLKLAGLVGIALAFNKKDVQNFVYRDDIGIYMWSNVKVPSGV